MTQFYAQPYSHSHHGFYFTSPHEYAKGMAQLESLGCEEVEIEFIDGDDPQSLLAQYARISQADIDLWYEWIEVLPDSEIDQILYLLQCGYSLEDAVRRYEEVGIWYGSAEDYAYELYQDSVTIPEHLEPYIDYAAIARDLRLGGDIAEVRDGVWCINPTDF
jgi:antirestriction protein